MKRFMLALAALALLGFSTSVALADVGAEAQNDGAMLQTAVLHAGNEAQFQPVWGYGRGYGGWGWGGLGYTGYGYGGYGCGYGGWGWGGWYGGGYWPYYGYYGGGYPYYGGYWSYPYYTYSYYPYWGYGGCCY